MLTQFASRSALPGLTFRLARPDEADCRRFCNLSNSLYARKVSPAYYYWQFFQTPHPSQLSFALTEEGELAGCYGLHLLEAGPNLRLGMALDIMVAPPFQGKGIFRALVEFALTQLQPYVPGAVYVLANQRAAGAHVHGLRWTYVNALTDYVCDTKRGMGFQPWRLKFQEGNDLTTWKPALQDLVNAHRRRTGLLTVARSPEFYEWRFIQNRRYRYQLFQANRDGNLFGFLALKVFRDPLTGTAFGDIADILWAEDDSASLTEMLRFALKYFHELGVAQATIWSQTNTVLDEINRATGFQPTKRERYLCIRPLANTGHELSDARQWYMTMVDSEVY